MSFHESGDDENDVEVDNDESARPCFSSIAKGAGSLDKDLAASGFTRKDQEDMEKVWKTICCNWDFFPLYNVVSFINEITVFSKKNLRW